MVRNENETHSFKSYLQNFKYFVNWILTVDLVCTDNFNFNLMRLPFRHQNPRKVSARAHILYSPSKQPVGHFEPLSFSSEKNAEINPCRFTALKKNRHPSITICRG